MLQILGDSEPTLGLSNVGYPTLLTSLTLGACSPKHVLWISVCRFKSQPYYRHLTATLSFGRGYSWGVAFRRRQLSAFQTMELPLDGDKYDSLLIFTVTGILRSVEWEIKDKQKQAALPDLNIVKRPKNVWNNQIQEQDFFMEQKDQISTKHFWFRRQLRQIMFLPLQFHEIFLLWRKRKK